MLNIKYYMWDSIINCLAKVWKCGWDIVFDNCRTKQDIQVSIESDNNLFREYGLSSYVALTRTPGYLDRRYLISLRCTKPLYPHGLTPNEPSNQSATSLPAWLVGCCWLWNEDQENIVHGDNYFQMKRWLWNYSKLCYRCYLKLMRNNMLGKG